MVFLLYFVDGIFVLSNYYIALQTAIQFKTIGEKSAALEERFA